MPTKVTGGPPELNHPMGRCGAIWTKATGLFLSAVINFIIVAFVLFMIIKGMNAAKKKEEAAAPAAAPEPSNQEKLLMEIRDALKK